MASPRQIRYSIKLVSGEHFNFAAHRHDFVGTPLMNFSTHGNSPNIAANIQSGDRAIVYETAPHQKFTHAIEYLGTVADGQRIARDQGLPCTGEWDTVVLPIRFLARVDLIRAPTSADILRDTGFDFRPVGFPMHYITETDYHAIFNAIHWDCLLDDADVGGR
jgi:hypothetical protein